MTNILYSIALLSNFQLNQFNFLNYIHPNIIFKLKYKPIRKAQKKLFFSNFFKPSRFARLLSKSNLG